MAADKRKPDISDEVIQSLARAILPSIQKYFESEEVQREIRRVENPEIRSEAKKRKDAIKERELTVIICFRSILFVAV
jgi:hypothetical protein